MNDRPAQRFDCQYTEMALGVFGPPGDETEQNAPQDEASQDGSDKKTQRNDQRERVSNQIFQKDLH